jgi:ribosomal protein S18 acetylase RimI-like enzyme
MVSKEFGGCFCTRFTSYDESWAERCLKRPAENYALTRARVQDGKHAGYIVFREMDGAAVGWIAAGPKTAFPRLKELPASRQGPWDDSAWAISCLAVGFPYRGLGYARRAVELALEEARRAGAKTVEAYPLDPEDDAQAHRGTKGLFQNLGFMVAGSEADGQRQALRMEKTLPVAEPAPQPAA